MRRGIDQPQRARIMGRVPTMTQKVLYTSVLTSITIMTSCENETTKTAARAATRERNEIVVAKKDVPKPKASAPNARPTPPPAPKPARKVCEGQLGKPRRDLTKKPLARKTTAGQKPP